MVKYAGTAPIHVMTRVRERSAINLQCSLALKHNLLANDYQLVYAHEKHHKLTGLAELLKHITYYVVTKARFRK